MEITAGPRMIALAAALTAAQPAQAALPEPIRALIDAAIATGDASKVRTVADLARTTNPAEIAEIDAILAVFESGHAARRAAEAEARQVELRKAGLFDNWSGNGEFGGFRATGNTSNTGVTVALTLNRQGIAWRHRFTGRADYQRAAGITTREQFLGRYEPNVNVSDNFYVFMPSPSTSATGFKASPGGTRCLGGWAIRR
jgi:putative salt-induced outer membrane protein